MQQSGTCEALVAAPGRVAAVQAVPSPSRWELHVPRTGLGYIQRRMERKKNPGLPVIERE